LRRLLLRKPLLVHKRSEFGHHSTLLPYFGSNGVETHRQIIPRNLTEIIQLVLDVGTDVNAATERYGAVTQQLLC